MLRKRLTPSPDRGDVVAAGAVVLATFAVLLDLRFGGTWAAGVRFVVIGALAALVVALAALAPIEEPEPRPYQATLHVTGFALTVLALGNLADALGAHGQFSSSGAVVWTGVLLVGLAGWFATRRRSPIMTLLAALSAVVVVNAFFDWVASASAQAHRWILLLCALGLVLGAVALRDLQRRHAVSLIDAAGLSIATLGLTLLLVQLAGNVLGRLGGGIFGAVRHGGPAGWELVLAAFGFGLVAYGAVDRERVPAFIGALVLALFVGVAAVGSTASLLWWPLILLAAALALLAIGLRPREPLPPEPPVPPAPAPPTAPTAVAGP